MSASVFKVNETGTALMAFSGTVPVGQTYRLVSVSCNFNAAPVSAEDFTITLDYASGSQATIVYSAGSPRGAGKERIDIMRGDRSAEIDDFRSLTTRSATKTEVAKYKPADKGHNAEFVVFREAIEGRRDRDELARFAVETSQATLGAVESLMTGQAISLDRS